MRIWRCELRKRIYQEFSHSLPFLRVSDVLDFISLGVERTKRRNNTISNARQPFRNSSWPQLNSQRISSLATLLICFPPTTSASFFWDYFFEKKNYFWEIASEVLWAMLKKHLTQTRETKLNFFPSFHLFSSAFYNIYSPTAIAKLYSSHTSSYEWKGKKSEILCAMEIFWISCLYTYLKIYANELPALT